MTSLPEVLRRQSTYNALAELPFTIESYSLDGLQRPWSPTFVRHTRVIRISGAGHDGVGEDVGYVPADHEAFQAAGAVLSLAGTHTFGSFSDRLDELELFPVAPQRENARAHRRWGFESAALDLALRQNGLSLAQAIGRECEPVRFLVSMRFPEPASAEPVLRRLELYPEMRFKLDVSESWTESLVAALADTHAVVAVDFKAHYEGSSVSGDGDPELYRMVVEGLPSALIEDPALTPDTLRVLEPHLDRITWDAPFTSVQALEALPVQPRSVNVKPSRFGTLRALLEAYEHLAARGIQAYGGGQFELGPGRGQIQYLASLFHADAGNDVAPLGHHEIRPGLPGTELAPAPSASGFGWAA